MNSICIATYNGEKYIAEQLRSILMQIQADDEVIISDDGSTDSTCAIIQALADSRIRLLHNNAHNFIRNFENALSHAQGEYIFFADQDDIWLEGKYEACLKALKDYDLVVTDSTITDAHLNVLVPSFFAKNHAGTGILKNIIRTTYCGACMAFTKRIQHLALPFPHNDGLGHDTWVGLVAEITGKVLFLKKSYLLYRRHESTTTEQFGNFLTRSKRNFFVKVWDRFVITIYVLKFYITYHARKHS